MCSESVSPTTQVHPYTTIQPGMARTWITNLLEIKNNTLGWTRRHRSCMNPIPRITTRAREIEMCTVRDTAIHKRKAHVFSFLLPLLLVAFSGAQVDAQVGTSPPKRSRTYIMIDRSESMSGSPNDGQNIWNNLFEGMPVKTKFDAALIVASRRADREVAQGGDVVVYTFADRDAMSEQPIGPRRRGPLKSLHEVNGVLDGMWKLQPNGRSHIWDSLYEILQTALAESRDFDQLSFTIITDAEDNGSTRTVYDVNSLLQGLSQKGIAIGGFDVRDYANVVKSTPNLIVPAPKPAPKPAPQRAPQPEINLDPKLLSSAQFLINELPDNRVTTLNVGVRRSNLPRKAFLRVFQNNAQVPSEVSVTAEPAYFQATMSELTQDMSIRLKIDWNGNLPLGRHSLNLIVRAFLENEVATGEPIELASKEWSGEIYVAAGPAIQSVELSRTQSLSVWHGHPDSIEVTVIGNESSRAAAFGFTVTSPGLVVSIHEKLTDVAIPSSPKGVYSLEFTGDDADSTARPRANFILKVKPAPGIVTEGARSVSMAFAFRENKIITKDISVEVRVAKLSLQSSDIEEFTRHPPGNWFKCGNVEINSNDPEASAGESVELVASSVSAIQIAIRAAGSPGVPTSAETVHRMTAGHGRAEIWMIWDGQSSAQIATLSKNLRVTLASRGNSVVKIDPMRNSVQLPQITFEPTLKVEVEGGNGSVRVVPSGKAAFARLIVSSDPLARALSPLPIVTITSNINGESIPRSVVLNANQSNQNVDIEVPAINAGQALTVGLQATWRVGAGESHPLQLDPDNIHYEGARHSIVSKWNPTSGCKGLIGDWVPVGTMSLQSEGADEAGRSVTIKRIPGPVATANANVEVRVSKRQLDPINGLTLVAAGNETTHVVEMRILPGTSVSNAMAESVLIQLDPVDMGTTQLVGESSSTFTLSRKRVSIWLNRVRPNVAKNRMYEALGPKVTVDASNEIGPGELATGVEGGSEKYLVAAFDDEADRSTSVLKKKVLVGIKTAPDGESWKNKALKVKWRASKHEYATIEEITKDAGLVFELGSDARSEAISVTFRAEDESVVFGPADAKINLRQPPRGAAWMIWALVACVAIALGIAFWPRRQPIGLRVFAVPAEGGVAIELEPNEIGRSCLTVNLATGDVTVSRDGSMKVRGIAGDGDTEDWILDPRKGSLRLLLPLGTIKAEHASVELDRANPIAVVAGDVVAAGRARICFGEPTESLHGKKWSKAPKS